MKKILFIFITIMTIFSCSSIKHTVSSEQINRLISSKINTTAKLGVIDIDIKHLNTFVKGNKIYSDISVELKGFISTAPMVFRVSYTLYFKDGKLKLANPQVESITDEQGNKLNIDAPFVKDPLNILIKYLANKEIKDIQNFNVPFDKTIEGINVNDDKVELYLK